MAIRVYLSRERLQEYVQQYEKHDPQYIEGFRDWFENLTGKRYKLDSTTAEASLIRYFEFVDDEEAVLFKLKWL